MPIYEYKCKKCGEKFEEFRYSKDSEKERDVEVKCPKCGTNFPERLFSMSSVAGSGCGSESFGPARG